LRRDALFIPETCSGVEVNNALGDQEFALTDLPVAGAADVSGVIDVLKPETRLRRIRA